MVRRNACDRLQQNQAGLDKLGRLSLTPSNRHRAWLLLLAAVIVPALLFTIYVSYRPTGVLVDVVLVVGEGGIKRKYDPLQIRPREELEEIFSEPLENGRALVETIELEFGFDNSTLPTLIRTIPKTQNVHYGRVIRLTANGRDEKSAQKYLLGIVGWMLARHKEVKEVRIRNRGTFVQDLDNSLDAVVAQCM